MPEIGALNGRGRGPCPRAAPRRAFAALAACTETSGLTICPIAAPTLHRRAFASGGASPAPMPAAPAANLIGRMRSQRIGAQDRGSAALTWGMPLPEGLGRVAPNEG